MKINLLIAAFAALFLIGCGSGESTTTPEAPPTKTSSTEPKTEAVTIGYDLGTIKKGDKAHCAVCVVKDGKTGEEAVAKTLDYEGKTYAFCSESEEAEFISNPTKYAAK